MVRNGNRSWCSLAVALTLAASGLAARTLAAPAPDPKAEARAKALSPPQVTQTLDAILETQRNLATAITQLRDRLNDVQSSVSQVHDELRQGHDTEQTALDQLKGMREEVRGLYVESSGVKSDVAQVGKQVESLDQSLGGFRLSSGVVVAVVIVLQVVLVGLLLRGRG